MKGLLRHAVLPMLLGNNPLKLDEPVGSGRVRVVHTLTSDRLQDCVAGLAKSDLPPLWKPRADQFVHVDSLPYLGTGKLDLRQLKEIARGATS